VHVSWFHTLMIHQALPGIVAAATLGNSNIFESVWRSDMRTRPPAVHPSFSFFLQTTNKLALCTDVYGSCSEYCYRLTTPKQAVPWPQQRQSTYVTVSLETTPQLTGQLR